MEAWGSIETSQRGPEGRHVCSAREERNILSVALGEIMEEEKERKAGWRPQKIGWKAANSLMSTFLRPYSKTSSKINSPNAWV